jgi:hypothetical protein
MNQQDELASRIAKLLDEGTEDLTAAQTDRLARARRLALSRHQQARAEPAWAPAWAGPFSQWTEQSLFGVRYVVPLAALILGLLGVLYVHTGGVPSPIADIDAGLLTDELPISAYLDQDFDSWLKRSSR